MKDEVSVLVGYPFAPDSEVTVDVDGQTFTLFTKEDGAWVESTADEQQLAERADVGEMRVVRADDVDAIDPRRAHELIESEGVVADRDVGVLGAAHEQNRNADRLELIATKTRIRARAIVFL